MSTLRNKLDYNLDMVAHYGASAVYRAGLWDKGNVAAQNVYSDLRATLTLAKRAKEKLDA